MIYGSHCLSSEFSAVHFASTGILSKMLVFRVWWYRSDSYDHFPSRGTRRAQGETHGFRNISENWMVLLIHNCFARTNSFWLHVVNFERGLASNAKFCDVFNLRNKKLWPRQARWRCPDPFSHRHLGAFGQELSGNLLNYCCEVNNRDLSFSSDKIGFMAGIATILLPNSTMSRSSSLPHSTPGFCQCH